MLCPLHGRQSIQVQRERLWTRSSHLRKAPRFPKSASAYNTRSHSLQRVWLYNIAMRTGWIALGLLCIGAMGVAHPATTSSPPALSSPAEIVPLVGSPTAIIAIHGEIDDFTRNNL